MSNNFSFIKRKLTALSLSLIASVSSVATSKAIAAERIFFVYNPVILSLRVESLEQFAEDGTVNQNLGMYFRLANVGEEEKAKFREALTKPVIVDPILLSRILNTEEAERLLRFFGQVIRIQGGQSNGNYVLRGALIKAAMEKDGLTLLNVLQNLAVNVQVEISQVIEYSNQIELIISGSNLFKEKVAILEQDEVKQSDPVDFSRLPDIRQPGTFAVENQTLNLYDVNRQRRFYVELYRPKNLPNNKIPVVIISHGLSSRPEDFARRAIHLASYGYVVAMPQHPGSDIIQTENFLAGLTRQIFLTNEFIDRPLDISYTIDELEKLNRTEFQGKLDLNNVGIFGHSFGAYGALSVAGATLNFDRLESSCSLGIGNFNTSLLLQCRALNLPRKDYQFRDERIKAVFAINPVNAAILGQKGLSQITIPTFIAAGSKDPATPFIFEQAQTFPFLNGSSTYLQLQEGQAHVDFSELDAGISDIIKTATNITLPAPDLLHDYTNSMMLAFFQTHIAQNPDYQVYLQSQYAQYLSEGQEFKTNLITKASAPSLKASFQEFIRQNQNLIR